MGRTAQGDPDLIGEETKKGKVGGWELGPLKGRREDLTFSKECFLKWGRLELEKTYSLYRYP